MEDNMSKPDRLYWEDEWDEVPKRKPGEKKGSPREFSGLLIPECRHWRQRFDLDDGLHVYASAWIDRPHGDQLVTGAGFEGEPDIGLYLDGRWAEQDLLTSPGTSLPFLPRKKRVNATKVILWPWRDYGLPEHPQLFKRMIRWLLSEIDGGRTIEIGCLGGHGRTGTAIACLLTKQGRGHSRAVSLVRSRYCEEAIESPKQRDFIRWFAQ